MKKLVYLAALIPSLAYAGWTESSTVDPMTDKVSHVYQQDEPEGSIVVGCEDGKVYTVSLMVNNVVDAELRAGATRLPIMFRSGTAPAEYIDTLVSGGFKQINVMDGKGIHRLMLAIGSGVGIKFQVPLYARGNTLLSFPGAELPESAKNNCRIA